MNGPAVIQLPNGFWHGGSRHVQAAVRPLTGHDEEFLLGEAAAYSPVRRATALLARCVVRLGPVSPVGEGEVGRLSAGDREALLLHLRRLTFGERMQATVSCPRAGCGQKLDLSLRVGDLLAPVPRDAAEWYEAEWASEGGTCRLRFRLPTGSDQEAAVEAAAEGLEAGVRTLVERCVLDTSAAPLPETAVALLSESMARLDPQAEIELAVRCAACGVPFRTLFDAGTWLFDEVGQRLSSLYREVHTLAFHYHWSEAEILGLPAGKRQRYLDMLREALGEEESA